MAHKQKFDAEAALHAPEVSFRNMLADVTWNKVKLSSNEELARLRIILNFNYSPRSPWFEETVTRDKKL